MTLTMAGSNYVAGELIDRFGFSPRVVTAGVGILFLLPGAIWFLTRHWWDREETVSRLEAGYHPPIANIKNEAGSSPPLND